MTFRLVLLAAMLVATCGCARAKHVQVVTVLNDGNCRTESTGIRLIDFATVAELRGARLLSMSDDGAKVPPVHLIAIIPGSYPTAGYSLELVNAAPPLADPLVLEVRLNKPPNDAILAQIVTHPCLVVGMDNRSVRRVRVEMDSQTLGEVDLTKSSGATR